MNNPQPPNRPASRHWLLSLLATRPGRRLFQTALITSLALNLSGPVAAERKLDQSPYSNPAVQHALNDLNLLTPQNGQQFQVNTYTTNEQRYGAVAMDSDGDFVVVWGSHGASGTDSFDISIQGQRYNSAGIPQSSQFQVNTETALHQRNPEIAMDSDGDFVVVWQSGYSYGSDTSYESIQGQRFNSSGAMQGPQFQVNTYTTYYQTRPAVAMDSDGDFVVAWQSYGLNVGDPYSVQAQRYNSAGTPQGSEFQVTNFTTDFQGLARVALDSDGDFVIVWTSGIDTTGSDCGRCLLAQRYNASGVPQSSPFDIDSGIWPDLAIDSSGSFVVVWHRFDGSGSGIYARRYNSAGTAQGSSFLVNTYLPNDQREASVAMDSDGDFVITWFSYGSVGNDTDSTSTQGRIFRKDGLPLVAEFQINSYTTNDQRYPVVAIDSNGDFVAVWRSEGSPANDTSLYSIQAARFDLGQLDFQVNSYTTNHQRNPAVATDSDGDFVIVWQSIGSTGDSSFRSIQARLFDNGGVPKGDQFQVNSYTTDQQINPAVAMDADGDFVIVWQSYGATGDASGYSVQAQRYNAAGTPQGSQFQVNTYTTNHQRNAAVAMDSSGNFIIAWESGGSSNGDASGYSIQQRRYNAAGTALDAADVRVNSYTTSQQRLPAVAAESTGDFVVVWASYGSATTDNSGFSIQHRRFTAAGTPLAADAQVNTYTTNFQFFPAVAMDSDGDFVVVWHSDGANNGDTSGYSIQAQRYNNAGAAAGSQLKVNSYTSSDQLLPAVSLDSDGDFVIVWQSLGSAAGDTSFESIHGQRYNSGGVLQGQQFQVNSYTSDKQLSPTIALDSSGNFTVAWESRGMGNPPFSPAEGDLQLPLLAPELDNDYAIVASRFAASAGPQPTALTLQNSNTALPTRAGLRAALTILVTLMTGFWLRLRRLKTKG